MLNIFTQIILVKIGAFSIRKIANYIACVIAALSFSVSAPHQIADASNGNTVGMWFDTNYTDLGNYDWATGFGSGSSQQLLGDVTGDGKADAVVYFNNYPSGYGSWYVEQSNGSSFGMPTLWLKSSLAANATKVFLADVTGRGTDDAVMYFASTGDWYVATSNGSSFNRPVLWASSAGIGSQNQMVADVTGDGRADVVVFYDVPNGSPDFEGAWYVAPSTGKEFNTSQVEPGKEWASGFGSGSQNQMLGDVTGSVSHSGHRVFDAVAYFDTGSLLGDWYVAPSKNSSFDTAQSSKPWITGHGDGSQAQMLGDTRGDGKDDAVVYFQDLGGDKGSAWYTANSTGSSFQIPSEWKCDHGYRPKSILDPADWVGLGDVYGNGMDAPVVFHNNNVTNTQSSHWQGVWQVMPANQYFQPEEMNWWQAYDIQYQPVVNGVAGIYDSGNRNIINSQLEEISRAGVDYLLFDLTNGMVGEQGQIKYSYISQRAKAVCEQIAVFDAQGHNLKFAIAGGQIQYSANPDTSPNYIDVDNEARFVLDNFITGNPTCAPYYFKWDGKPLLGMYFHDPTEESLWDQYSGKTMSRDFTIKPILGMVPQINPGTNSSARVNGGCGNIPSTTSPASSEFGDYLGWGEPYGAFGRGPIMVAQPGWNNHDGPDNTSFISRTQNNVPDGFYINCGWKRILANKSTASMVIISSYNDFNEDTAVEPANTSQLTKAGYYPSERWPSAMLYWNDTILNISRYKN